MPSTVLGIQWRTKETQSLPLAFSASANSFCSPSYILGQRDHAALFGHLKRESMEGERYGGNRMEKGEGFPVPTVCSSRTNMFSNLMLTTLISLCS